MHHYLLALLTPVVSKARWNLYMARVKISKRTSPLWRTRPIYAGFPWKDGGPVDRYYIEGFLERHREDVRGHVLEAGDAELGGEGAEDVLPAVDYTRRFGGDRVSRGDVIYPKPGFPDGTLVGDLATGEGIPDADFDCLILTQVFCFIYDVRAAAATCRRALRPGGVLLATVPCISQICAYDQEQWGDYWRFTVDSAQRLFAEAFGPENVTVESHGNVLAVSAFLHNMAVSEVERGKLDQCDPHYPLIITVRAVRPAEPPAS